MRGYCRCSAVRNFDYDEAADKLRCKKRFLQDNISRLPHQKLGESVAFCECELALIQRLFSILPAPVEPELSEEPAPVTVPVLATIRPSGGRRARVG